MTFSFFGRPSHVSSISFAFIRFPEVLHHGVLGSRAKVVDSPQQDSIIDSDAGSFLSLVGEGKHNHVLQTPANYPANILDILQ